MLIKFDNETYDICFNLYRSQTYPRVSLKEEKNFCLGNRILCSVMSYTSGLSETQRMRLNCIKTKDMVMLNIIEKDYPSSCSGVFDGF